MKKPLRDFNISFSGLKLGKHLFDFKIDKAFFNHFDEVEFNNPRVLATIELEKQNTIMELSIAVQGTVEVICDISNTPFDLEIENSALVVVKFGDTFNDDDDDVLILPNGAHQVDVSKYLYELVVLAIPLKRVHPDVLNGKLGKEYLKLLKAYSPEKENQEHQNETQREDPRWSKLKDLLN